MKRNLMFGLWIALLSIGFLQACKESIEDFGEVEFLDASRSIVKINMASVYPDDRYMYVKFNDRRVTPLIRAREPYPGGGYNTRGPSSSEFLMVDAGLINVKICLPHKVDNGMDSLVLSSHDISVDAGGRYTFHVADTGINTRVIPTQETFLLPDSAYASYRFINLMPNVEAIDLYYGYFSTTAAGQTATQDSIVAAGIKYGEVSPTFVLHRTATRTFKIRPAGAEVNNQTVLAYYANAGATLNQRQYTAFALGYAGQSSTILRPYVSFMLIR